MKKEDIFSAMGNIDEVYLNESEAAPSIKIKAGLGIGKTLAVAAALILMFGAALVLPKMANNNLIDPAGTVITDELSPSIDMALRAHFDLDGDDVITTEMLNSITSLKIYRQDDSALSGTEYSLVRFEINGDNNFAAALPELMRPNYYEYVVGMSSENVELNDAYQVYYTCTIDGVYAFDDHATDREVRWLYGMLYEAGFLDAWKISGDEFDISSLKYFEKLEKVEFVGVTPVGYTLPDSISVKINGKDDNDTFDADIVSIIDQNLDIIMEGSDDFIEEQDYVNARPEAFENIVALGEDALPYLEKLTGNIGLYDTSIENKRHIIAAYLSYLIKPELYDISYPSPDGKYEIRAVVESFFTLYDPFTGVSYMLHLVDNSDGSVIATASGAYSLANASGESLISWSLDSKYAMFEDSYRHMYTNIILFDTTNSSCHTLYDEGGLETFAKRDFSYTSPDGTVWDRVHCNFAEWGEDSLKITLSLASAAGGRLTFGSYVYEIPTKHAQRLEYDLDLDEQWKAAFGPWEDDGIEIIEVDGVKVPLPSKYFAAGTLEFYAEHNENGRENGLLATVINAEERSKNGGGTVLRIYRLTREQYEEISKESAGASCALATDGEYYYTMSIPTSIEGDPFGSFMEISEACQNLVREHFAEINGFATITEPTPVVESQIDGISIATVDGIKIPIYNKHESYSDIGYDTDGDYFFILYDKPAYEAAGGGNQYLFKLYKYTKHEYLYNFASDAEFGVPPAVNDFRSRASVVAVDGDYYYVMLIGDAPPTRTTYSNAVEEYFAELNGFEKLNDENNVLEEIFTYDSEHKYFRYYPDGIDVDYFYMIVLSQPVKQGEGGIWCVDRYFSMQTSGTPLVDTAGRPTIGWQIHLPVLPFDGEYTDFDAYYAAQQQEYDSGNPDYEVLGNPYSLINDWCRATFGEGYSASSNIVQVDYLATGIYDY